MLLCLLFSTPCFSASYIFTSGQGLSPNNNNFPTNPLDMGQDGEPSNLSVNSGTMQGTGSNGTVVSNGNSYGKQINVAIGASISYIVSSTFGNTITLNLGDSSGNPLTINNNGIIQRLNSSSGQAINMNFSQSNSSISITNLANNGLINGTVQISTGTGTINTYSMGQADPSVNGGVTEVNGSFLVGSMSAGTIFRVGFSSTTNCILNRVTNIPTITMGNFSSTLRVRGIIGDTSTGGTAMNQPFNIPANNIIFVESTGAFRSTSTIVLNANAHLNIQNNFTLSTAAAGGFTSNGNIYLNDSGKITGNLTAGQALRVGVDSAGNNYTGTNTTTAGTIANIPIINIVNGTFAVANSIAGISTSFTVSSGATTNISAAIGGTGQFIINSTGTVFLNTGGSIGTTGAFTNSGNLNIAVPGFNPSGYSPFTLSGGGIYVIGAGTLAGALAGNGSAGSSLNIGKDSTGANNSNTFSANGAISNIPNINVYTGSFSTNGFAITGLSNNFFINSGATATLNASVTGTATNTSSNSGTLNISSTFGLTGFTNASGGQLFLQGGAANSTAITNNGTITVSGAASNSSTITNNNSLANGGGTLTNTGTLVFANNSTSAATITNNNIINISGTSSSSGSITHAGSITGTGTFTTSNSFSFTNGSSNASNGITNTGTLSFAGTVSNTGTITNRSSMQGATGQLTNALGATIVFGTGSQNTVNLITNNGTLSITGANATSSANITNNNIISGAGTLAQTANTLTMAAGSSNSSTINNSATINITGAATNTGSITNTNILSGSGPLTNNTGGTISFATGSQNSATIINNATINVSGTNTINTGSITNNSSTISVAGGGILNNNSGGTIFFGTGSTNSATINNNAGGILNISGTNPINTGTITNINSITGSGTLRNTSGTIIFGTNSQNAANINNTAIINVTGTNAINTATITNTGSTLSGGASNLLTNSLPGVIIFATNATNSANITNDSTVTINNSNTNTGTITNNNAITGSGTLLNSTGTIVLANGSTSSPTITNNSTLTVNGSATNTGTITNNHNMTGSGTLTNNSGAFLSLTDLSTATPTIINNGTMSATGSVSSGSITNNNQFTITNSTINMAGKTLSGAGALNVSGTNTLTATSYTSAGTYNTSITDATTFDKLTVVGNVNLSGATLNVTSAFTSTSTKTWDIITATSLTGPTTIVLPSGAWSSNVTSTTLRIIFTGFVPPPTPTVTYPDYATNPINTGIAEVLQQMENNITNAGQRALINAFNRNTGTLDHNFQQMTPNFNANSTNVAMQNAALNKVEVRISNANNSNPYASGLAFGEINCNTALWAGGFGSIAQQDQVDLNYGYRAKSLGYIAGIDHRTLLGNLIGVAFAVANSNVEEFSNNNFKTHIMSYNGLLYGSADYQNSPLFAEWMLNAAVNTNNGNRPINVNGSNFSVTSSYDSYQSGLRLNFGQANGGESWTFSLIETLRYLFAYNPSYSESGSVAALNVSPQRYSNLFTVGGGARLSLPGKDPWFTGSREIRITGTYDVIRPHNTTFANFIVGSSDFSVQNPISPWGVQIGADFAFTFCERLQIQFSYDFELRERYTDNSGAIKLKLLF